VADCGSLYVAYCLAVVGWRLWQMMVAFFGKILGFIRNQTVNIEN
jgi:hypothetical protein